VNLVLCLSLEPRFTAAVFLSYPCGLFPFVICSVCSLPNYFHPGARPVLHFPFVSLNLFFLFSAIDLRNQEPFSRVRVAGQGFAFEFLVPFWFFFRLKFAVLFLLACSFFFMRDNAFASCFSWHGVTFFFSRSRDLPLFSLNIYSKLLFFSRDVLERCLVLFLLDIFLKLISPPQILRRCQVLT